jgi:hypothetical protein
MPSSRMPSGRVAPGANRGQPSNSKGGNWWQSPFCGSHTGGRVNAQAAVLHTSHASVRPQRVEDLQAREVPFVFRDNHAMIRLGDGGNDHVERAAGPLRQRRERDAVSVARNDGEDRGLPRDVACCVDGGIVLALPGVLRHGGGRCGVTSTLFLTALPKQSASASILRFCHVYRNPVADHGPIAHADDDEWRRLGRPGIADAESDADFDADPDCRPAVRRGTGRIEPSWRRRDPGAESN